MHLLLFKLLVSPHSLGSEYWATAKIINQVSRTEFLLYLQLYFFCIRFLYVLFRWATAYVFERILRARILFKDRNGMKVARRSLWSRIVMLHFLRTASAVKQQTELTESNWNGRCCGVERMFRRFVQWNEINFPFSW